MQLLPRDEKFFDLLVAQGRIVFEASRLFADGMGDGAAQPDSDGTSRKVRDLSDGGPATDPGPSISHQDAIQKRMRS
jgi:hypothetical protein